MKLLADANVEAALVRWLRSRDHDVAWAVDFPPSCPDAEVLRIANEQQRIVLTHDRDFGELAFRRGLAAEGVILLRFEAPLQADRLALLQLHWQAIEQSVPGHFLVVSDRTIRIRPLP